MKLHSLILALPLIVFGTTPVVAQEDDRSERGECRTRSRASAAAELDRDIDGRLNERGRAADRDRDGRARYRGDRAGRGPRRAFEDARTRRPEPRADGLRRRGPGPGTPSAESRRPSARMLLARFDRDGDRELDVRELSRLLERMPRFRPGGPGGPPREGEFNRPRGPRPPLRGDDLRPGGRGDRFDGVRPWRERPVERRFGEDRPDRPRRQDPNP